MGAEREQELPGYDPAHEDDVSRRRLLLPANRIRGLLLLAILPLVALLGLTSLQGQASAVSEGLELSADYPRVLRYLKPAGLNLGVTNHGDAQLQAVSLSIDQDYLDAFTGLTFMPAEQGISDGRVFVELGDIDPGETLSLRLELRASVYWRHPVTFRASSGSTTVDLPAATLVLP